jgi:hypothetical protein
MGVAIPSDPGTVAGGGPCGTRRGQRGQLLSLARRASVKDFGRTGLGPGHVGWPMAGFKAVGLYCSSGPGSFIIFPLLSGLSKSSNQIKLVKYEKVIKFRNPLSIDLSIMNNFAH